MSWNFHFISSMLMWLNQLTDRLQGLSVCYDPVCHSTCAAGVSESSSTQTHLGEQQWTLHFGSLVSYRRFGDLVHLLQNSQWTASNQWGFAPQTSLLKTQNTSKYNSKKHVNSHRLIVAVFCENTVGEGFYKAS